MRLVLAWVFIITATCSTNADELKFDEVDPKGMPSGYKPGLSARYVIWYDTDGWHIRVTTSAALTKFMGTVEPVDGKIISMKLVSGKKGADLPPLDTKSKSISLSNELGKGLQSGYDFKLEDSATAIKFDLKINDKESPELIFIGANGVHPKGSAILLPAKPGKKGK